MKALKILFVLSMMVIVSLGVLFFVIQSPVAKQFVIAKVSKHLGTPIQINDLNISLFSGITLRGLTIDNPEGFNGSLLTVDEAVLRYHNLWSLVHKRLEMETLALRKPMVTLAHNEQGQWNYQQFHAKSVKLAGTTTVDVPRSSTHNRGLDITLANLSLENAEMVILNETSRELARAHDLVVTSKLQTSGTQVTGDGNANMEALSINSLMIHKITAPFKISTTGVTLTPINGTLADGVVSGSIDLKLADTFQYTANLKVKDGDMERLLQEANLDPILTGKLQGETSLIGGGNASPMTGDGKLEIVNGALVDAPLLENLSVLLQMNELRNIKFTECRIEFTVGDHQISTPVIRILSPQLWIFGQGVISLVEHTLNHEMTLAVAPEMLAKIPTEISSIFKKQPDGFLGITFHISGPYHSPKTDIKKILLEGAARSLFGKGLNKFLR